MLGSGSNVQHKAVAIGIDVAAGAEYRVVGGFGAIFVARI